MLTKRRVASDGELALLNTFQNTFEKRSLKNRPWCAQARNMQLANY